MARLKNKVWDIQTNENGNVRTWDEVQLVVLMDIRDELQELNRVMQCRNVSSGFRALAKMARRDEQAFERRVAAAARKRANRAALKARK